ncbi:MAG: PVC-type heme-binding CxxCH protein [Pirellulales bacterium]
MARYLFHVALVLLIITASSAAAEVSLKDHENRFEITLFAEQPQIVNPIGIQVDDRGRVFVIESHTHFRPKDYGEPKADRILLLEDTNGDQRADKRTIFHEGFVHAMDLALHDDGSLYVATRSAVHRLRDKDNDGRADEAVKLIDLQTKGNYPHNGLSGLAFDRKGGMYFGFGENLGEAYKLVGSDGTTLAGQGEGGNVYHCQLDGTKLRQVATGFWNPFGLCVDPAGNVFATDNDPDSSPPCRLLHVIEGGDYGYEFRYGRSGLHVFQSWHGELPGTLPMVTGTGEAPCEIIPYDGGLLVASWADNRLEHYTLKPRGASFAADRKILISGDLNFRPVGIGAAKDGTLYVSDWASASYELPGKGKVWRLKPKEAPSRSTAIASENSLAAIHSAKTADLLPQLISSDPFIRAAAIERLSQLLSNHPSERKVLQETLAVGIDTDYCGILAALRRSTWDKRHDFIPQFLQNRAPEVRFLALKWIADERLAGARDGVADGLRDANLTRDLLAAHLAALERIDGKKIGDLPDPALVLPIVKNVDLSPKLRAFALRLLPPQHPALSLQLLQSLFAQTDLELRLEVLRTANERPTDERRRWMERIAADEKEHVTLRAEAASGLAGDAAFKSTLIMLALDDNASLRNEALRSLVDMSLTKDDKERLSALKEPPEAARLLGETPPAPPLDDMAAWLERTAGEGDPEAGRRIFFHSKVGYCSRCHRYDGRGNHVGPDLTKIHERGREWLLTSIIQPARDIAPAYVQWQIVMQDGTSRVGISLRKGSHSEDYLGADGKTFSVRLADMESRSEIATSMMPDGLPQAMTAKELRDVMAFLLGK